MLDRGDLTSPAVGQTSKHPPLRSILGTSGWGARCLLSFQLSPRAARLVFICHQWSKADLPTAPIHWKSCRSSLLYIFQVIPKCPERCKHWIRNPVDLSNSSTFTSGTAFLQAQQSQGSCFASVPSWLSAASCTTPLMPCS